MFQNSICCDKYLLFWGQFSVFDFDWSSWRTQSTFLKVRWLLKKVFERKATFFFSFDHWLLSMFNSFDWAPKWEWEEIKGGGCKYHWACSAEIIQLLLLYESLHTYMEIWEWEIWEWVANIIACSAEIILLSLPLLFERLHTQNLSHAMHPFSAVWGKIQIECGILFCVSLNQIRTWNRMRVAIESGKGMKVKVLK